MPVHTGGAAGGMKRNQKKLRFAMPVHTGGLTGGVKNE